MFKDKRLVTILCLVVFVSLVISIFQLMPTRKSGQEIRGLSFKNNWKVRISFEGETLVHYYMAAFERYQLRVGDKEIESWWIDGVFAQIHEDGPTQNKIVYNIFDDLEEGTHSFLLTGTDVSLSLYEYSRDGEYLGEDLVIEVFIYPTASTVALTLARNIGLSLLLFLIVMLMTKFFREVSISWKRKELLINGKLILVISALSLAAVLLLSGVQSRQREFNGREVEVIVPVDWNMRIGTSSWALLLFESEEPIYFVTQERNPREECRDYAYEHDRYGFIGAPNHPWHTQIYPETYWKGEREVFRGDLKAICPGEYTWNLRGEKAFLLVFVRDEDSEGEIEVLVYPSKEAINQIIINNVKLVFMVNILVISSIIVLPRIKFEKKIE